MTIFHIGIDPRPDWWNK